MSVKRNNLKGAFWMCYSWLFRVTLHVCPLFVQAVCTEKPGVSAHAALPLQECRAKESWREWNSTHSERLTHCGFGERTSGQGWAGASHRPLILFAANIIFQMFQVPAEGTVALVLNDAKHPLCCCHRFNVRRHLLSSMTQAPRFPPFYICISRQEVMERTGSSFRIQL